MQTTPSEIDVLSCSSSVLQVKFERSFIVEKPQTNQSKNPGAVVWDFVQYGLDFCSQCKKSHDAWSTSLQMLISISMLGCQGLQRTITCRSPSCNITTEQPRLMFIFIDLLHSVRLSAEIMKIIHYAVCLFSIHQTVLAQLDLLAGYPQCGVSPMNI